MATTEFQLNLTDFCSELDALAEMAALVGRSGEAGPSARARIAAGNAVVLLIAATFEEFVRQQVRTAFRERAKGATSMAAFPASLASSVWRRSLERLAKSPFDEIEADGNRARNTLSITEKFCLGKDITADVSEMLSHNENNMRPGELGRLFNQIGIPSIVAKAAGAKDIADFLGRETSGQASEEIVIRMEEFFWRRNQIAHAIKLGASSGTFELARDVEFFRRFGEALTAALEAEFKDREPPKRSRRASQVSA